MKLLMFDSPEFWYRTHSKTLESVEAVHVGGQSLAKVWKSI